MRNGIAGVVLSGGRSTRMGGGDKGLLALAGRPILAHVVSRLEPQVETLVLNANGDASRFDTLGLPIVPDTVEGFAGPLAGILAGLQWASAQQGLKAMVSAAADTPFLPLDLVERLVAAVAKKTDRIAVSCSNGRRHPVFALWPVSLRAPLQAALAAGERKVSAFLDKHGFVDVDFPVTGAADLAIDPFFNINTPAELAEAERLLKSLPR